METHERKQFEREKAELEEKKKQLISQRTQFLKEEKELAQKKAEFAKKVAESVEKGDSGKVLAEVKMAGNAVIGVLEQYVEGENWDQWLERLEQYILVNDIKED